MTAKRKGPMTLDQLYAQLKAEGRSDAMIERHRLQDEEHQKRVAELLKAEAPLLADLRAAGYEMESVWDLVNTAIPYPKALPVLLEHLPRPYPGRVREGIARALAVPEARFAWDLYTRYYREEPDGRVKEGMAAAIAVMGRTEERIDEVIAVARDRRNGQSRILLLRALSRSRDPRARAERELIREAGTRARSKQLVVPGRSQLQSDSRAHSPKVGRALPGTAHSQPWWWPQAMGV